MRTIEIVFNDVAYNAISKYRKDAHVDLTKYNIKYNTARNLRSTSFIFMIKLYFIPCATR